MFLYEFKKYFYNVLWNTSEELLYNTDIAILLFAQTWSDQRKVNRKRWCIQLIVAMELVWYYSVFLLTTDNPKQSL